MSMRENLMGSDELSEEESSAYDQIEEDAVKALEEAANLASEARVFLNSNLGRALRKYIVVNRHAALENIAVKTADELVAAKQDLEVINVVAQFFGNIIVGGDEAIANLDQMRVQP